MNIHDLFGILDYALAGAILGFVGGFVRILREIIRRKRMPTLTDSWICLTIAACCGSIGSWMCLTHTEFGTSLRAVFVLISGYAGSAFLDGLTKILDVLQQAKKR